MHRILAISGSLRTESYNTRLLHALGPLAPAGMSIDVFDGLGDVPLFNEDFDTDPAPPPVARLREAVSATDGLVIATPEYNHSLPGVLKNAIDWLSRPHGRGALSGKAVAVMVATLGRTTGYRCFSDTVRLVGSLGNVVVPAPEVVIASAPSALETSPDGTVRLVDKTAAGLIRVQLEVLADVLGAQAHHSLRQAVESNRAIIERARFFPYVARALADGATPETVTERLLSAGQTRETVAGWIAEARAADVA
ncbi:NADPH-dependent FMN reductase [Streptomyces rimosus]|uniref:NADPH-dependent FMN reductase n=1 Tax=Streptomyces rimosus TaxID=1927 RepID=UPI00067B01C8